MAISFVDRTTIIEWDSSGENMEELEKKGRAVGNMFNWIWPETSTVNRNWTASSSSIRGRAGCSGRKSSSSSSRGEIRSGYSSIKIRWRVAILHENQKNRKRDQSEQNPKGLHHVYMNSWVHTWNPSLFYSTRFVRRTARRVPTENAEKNRRGI